MGMINLQKIFMSNCQLEDVAASAFENLAILIELDLSHNRLESLHRFTFMGNIKIRKLWLSHNPLRTLGADELDHRLGKDKN